MPKTFHFEKWEGLGNDFVLCNLLYFGEQKNDQEWFLLAQELCDRRRGVGADGLVLLLPSSTCDVRFRVFNSDGSEAQMCGNALRCAVAYCAELWKKSDRLSFETEAGTRWGEICPSGWIKALVGTGSWIERERSVIIDADVSIGVPMVSVGNPHAVLFDWEESWKDRAEDYTRSGVWLPQGVNVEFVTVQDREHVAIEIMERGSGWTQACGTGAAATVWAGHRLGLLEQSVQVSMPGGTLGVQLDGDRIFMEGPARRVFRGTLSR